jgi:DNA mismatch endonuclease (patch repair protein)
MAGVRRRADIVFVRAQVAVFVDGCFWHHCPDHGTTPRHNGEWWAAKLDRTVARDRETDARLETAGWTVLRIWEHECPSEAADRVERAVRPGDPIRGRRLAKSPAPESGFS